jgi:hypothetical protein
MVQTLWKLIHDVPVIREAVGAVSEFAASAVIGAGGCLIVGADASLIATLEAMAGVHLGASFLGVLTGVEALVALIIVKEVRL